MSESFRAVCNDFYVNQKLAVKMDLPRGRDTVLDMFERVRKSFPAMNVFRRYRDELALEAAAGETPHRWVAVRSSNVRSGVVNPATLEEGYGLHKLVLESAPFYLNVSALDVDYVELLFGFDMMAGGNHDAIVFEALLAGSPMASLADLPGATTVDCQPLVGVKLSRQDDVEVHFEVKTRQQSPGTPREDGAQDPISVYLTMRRFGAVSDVKELVQVFGWMTRLGEELAESRVIPRVLVPLRDAIASGNA